MMAAQDNEHTIYLTEKEADRIRDIVQERVKKCSESEGQVREPRDSTAAIKQATGASLMADMGGAPDPDMAQTKGQGSTLPVLAVGQPYPPCTVPLQHLEPIKLADLRMNTHHHGRRLTIKRVSPVVTLAARSWTMIQDEEEEVERFEVCLHTLRHGEDVLESASSFVIKEPYFTLTDQGEATIRIDHPSDLSTSGSEVTNGRSISNGELNGHAEEAAEAEKIARKHKDDGNAALKRQDLPLAHAKYTEGLRIARRDGGLNTSADLSRDISRNRAHVNLLLGQLDEAIADAEASLIRGEDQRSKDLDSKAYMRAGRAAYNLGNYEEAKRCFTEQLKLRSDDKEASTNLRRVVLRLHEEEKGTHDFKIIKAGLSRARPRVDAATFISNTQIGESSGRGRGLFATRDIPAGELVMCEKAFCVVWAHEKEALTAMTYDVRDNRIRFSPIGLTKSIVQKLLNNPSQIERVMDLYGEWPGDGKNVSIVEDGPVVDIFRVHDIMSRNAHGPRNQFGEEGGSKASSGLWIWAAYMNHSCIPNVQKEILGDLMMFRAMRPIAAGEEIFQSYDESSDYDTRQAALMTTWGFECDCALCRAEKVDDPSVRKKRKDLASEAYAFLQSEHWTNAKRLTITRAQRLKRAIDDTYDAERYKDVPRTASQGIKEWLAKASPRK